MSAHEVWSLSWADVGGLAARVTDRLIAESFDLVIGIARGGLPLAVHLSHHLDCRSVGVVFAQKSLSDAAYAFAHDGTIAVSGLALPDVTPRRILVVDDVVAVGDVFAVVDRILDGAYGPDISVSHAALVLDCQAVAAGPHAGLEQHCTYGAEVDNSSTWVVFPWEQPVAA